MILSPLYPQEGNWPWAELGFGVRDGTHAADLERMEGGIWAQLPGTYGGAGTEGGRHGPGETEEDEAGRGGVLCGGQEWRTRGQEAARAAG